MGRYSRTKPFTPGTDALGTDVSSEFDAVGQSVNNIEREQVRPAAIGAEQLGPASVTESKIADDAVTLRTIAAALSVWTEASGNAVNASTGALTLTNVARSSSEHVGPISLAVESSSDVVILVATVDHVRLQAGVGGTVAHADPQPYVLVAVEADRNNDDAYEDLTWMRSVRWLDWDDPTKNIGDQIVMVGIDTNVIAPEVSYRMRIEHPNNGWSPAPVAQFGAWRLVAGVFRR